MRSFSIDFYGARLNPHAIARARLFGIFIQLAAMTAAPELSDSAERLAEIAEILAAGLMRLRARKSSGLLPGERDFSLETLARQSSADPNSVSQIEGAKRDLVVHPVSRIAASIDAHWDAF